MKTNKTAPKYEGRGVSIPTEMKEKVDARLEKMGPWAPTFSNYVQRLIALDLKLGLLRDDGGVNKDVVNDEGSFNFGSASMMVEALSA